MEFGAWIYVESRGIFSGNRVSVKPSAANLCLGFGYAGENFRTARHDLSMLVLRPRTAALTCCFRLTRGLTDIAGCATSVILKNCTNKGVEYPVWLHM